MELMLTLHGCLPGVTDGFDCSEFERAGTSSVEIDARARALIGTHLSDQHMSIYKKSVSARALWDAQGRLYNQKK